MITSYRDFVFWVFMGQIGKPAIVLLSGGLDSTTVLAYAVSSRFQVYALSFDYGQRNRFEFHCAEQIAKTAGVCQHQIVRIDLRAFGGSSLTSDESVEKDRSVSEIGEGIPRTYVPARNTIFLSFSLAFAEVVNAKDIFIGVNAVDSSGYPDCRAEYINSFENMANLATRIGTESGERILIHAPLLNLRKHEIISMGLGLGVDYSKTSSCYDPTSGGVPCGRCDACFLRQRGFYDAGVEDPLRYETRLSREKI